MKLSQLLVTMIFIGSAFSVFATETRYTIIDLGRIRIEGVNNSGQGVGYTMSGNRPLVTDSSGNVIILGKPEGYPGLGNSAINDSGKAIFSLPEPGGLRPMWHAFITDSSNNLIDLGTLDGFGESFAMAINNNGQITGYSSVSGPGYHAYVTDSNYNMIDIGTLETGGTSKGYDINDSGQVVGGSEIVRTNGTLYAFVTDSNFNMDTLRPFPNSSSRIPGSASFINNNGLVAGYATWGSYTGAYVIDSNGELTRIPGRIAAINDNGQVTGNSGYIYDGGYSHAYVTGSSYDTIDLGTLGGLQSRSSAINNSGQVVGYSEINQSNTDTRAFITDSDNNMIELSTLVNNLSNNWEYLSYAYDISDTGYIIGDGKTINGDHHAYLLTPVYLTAEIITIEPDNFTSNSNISDPDSDVTLSATGSAALSSEVFAIERSGQASTGTHVFGYNNDGFNGQWFSPDQVLRIDFSSLTDFVSIDVHSFDSFDVGHMEIYNESDILLDTISSGSLTGDNLFETISTGQRASADIAYALVFGSSSTDTVAIDNLQFNKIVQNEGQLQTLTIINFSINGESTEQTINKKSGEKIRIIVKPKPGYIAIISVDGEEVMVAESSNQAIRYRLTIFADHTIETNYRAVN